MNDIKISINNEDWDLMSRDDRTLNLTSKDGDRRILEMTSGQTYMLDMVTSLEVPGRIIFTVIRDVE